jgi:DHA1 family tetracycline resistance protein-like MFS transporter
MFNELGRNNRLVMLSLLVWALGEGLWYNLRQLYLAELGATPGQIGTVLAIEAAGRAALLLPAGYVCDRIGPHRVMIFSWLLGLAGPLVMLTATTWQMLIPGLLVYALSAFAVPAISSYALLSMPQQNPSVTSERVLSTLYAAYPAGLLISPALGGLIADHFGIRTCLWGAAGIYTLSTLLIVATRNVKPREMASESHAGSLLNNRVFVGLAVYYALAAFTLYMGYPLAQNFLQDVRLFSFSQIGFLFSMSAVGTIASNLLLGRASPRWGFVGLMITVWAALLGIWRLTSLGGLSVAFFCLGTIFTARILATAGIARVVGPQQRGMAFSIIEILFTTAMALASQVAGILYETTPTHDLPYVASLATIPVMLGLWFVVRKWRDTTSAGKETPISVTPPDSPAYKSVAGDK